MRLASDLGVLRSREFRYVFGAAFVSLLGDGMVPVAMTFAVLDLTGSATDLGVVLAADTLALVGSLLIGGVVADRLSRRIVMMGADVVRLFAQGAAGGLLVTGHVTVVELVVSQAFLGAATGFFNPASSGLIPLVAGDRLQQANSLRGMAMAAGNIVGPAVAGVLVVAASPGVALLIDAGSYGASALLLTRVTSDLRAGASQRFFTELRDGFTEFRARTWVWATIAALSIANAAGVGFAVLGPVVAKHKLDGAGAWAVILAVRGIGSLVAGTTLLRFRPRRPLLMAVLIGLLPPVPMFLLAVPAPLAVIAVAALLAGVGGMVFNTLWETTLQQYIPADARSRVSAYDWFGSLALSTFGFAVIGPFAVAVGTSTALYLCAAADVVVVALLLGLKDIRTLPARPTVGDGAVHEEAGVPISTGPVGDQEQAEPR